MWRLCGRKKAAARFIPPDSRLTAYFSKQFKNIVGISPSAFMKQAAKPDATIRGSSKVEKK